MALCVGFMGFNGKYGAITAVLSGVPNVVRVDVDPFEHGGLLKKPPALRGCAGGPRAGGEAARDVGQATDARWSVRVFTNSEG